MLAILPSHRNGSKAPQQAVEQRPVGEVRRHASPTHYWVAPASGRNGVSFFNRLLGREERRRSSTPPERRPAVERPAGGFKISPARPTPLARKPWVDGREKRKSAARCDSTPTRRMQAQALNRPPGRAPGIMVGLLPRSILRAWPLRHPAAALAASYLSDPECHEERPSRFRGRPSKPPTTV